LAYALAGHPQYHLQEHSAVSLNDRPISSLPPHERSRLGLFYAFQYPVAIPGVSVQNFLKTAYEQLHCANCQSGTKMGECHHLSVLDFRRQLHHHSASLGIKPDLLSRSLNDGFSGGEKKRLEILQLLTLKPRYAILDESDSGLDIDSIKLLATAINQAVTQNHTGVLVISHYLRLFEHLKPDYVHIMLIGRLVKSGGAPLIQQLDAGGFQQFAV
jgi:Fe-S cluster assembly ATP-binding protein